MVFGAPPFQILTTHLPLPRAGHVYEAQLEAEGGTPPVRWRIVQGALPPGLQLDPDRGRITGVAHSSAAFSVLIEARDSAQPPLAETRLLPASDTAPLELTWSTPPARGDGQITGALQVRNALQQTIDLVVIVAAVDETGKAFALRYARLPLTAGEPSPPLAFSVALPPGSYTLHADAVAANPATGAIYRQRLERQCSQEAGECR